MVVALAVPAGVSAQTAPGVAGERAAVLPFDNISGRAEDA